MAERICFDYKIIEKKRSILMTKMLERFKTYLINIFLNFKLI